MDVREKIKNIAVLGAGLMGHGIAEVCAIAGYNVVMRDIKPEFIDRGMQMIKDGLAKLEQKGRIKSADDALSNIKTTLELEGAVKDADLVIEAVPEIFKIKEEVFKECDKIAKPECIFTSNTSTIKITDLAKVTSRGDKFAGLHFFNPPVLMKLVEVIRGEETSEETMQILVEFVKSIGKTPVKVEKDVPGFIVNRIQAPAGVLLMGIIEKRIATPEEVDATVRRLGLPMGPFELIDYTGVDTFYNAMKYYARTISPDYEPPEFLEKMVKENKLGRKTGVGWYDWSTGRPQIDSSKAANKINPMDFTFVEINEAIRLVEMGVASPDDIDTAIKLGLNRPFGPFELAKQFEDKQIVVRLEELAKTYEKKIFEPAKTLKEGKLEELVKKGKVESKGEKDVILRQ